MITELVLIIFVLIVIVWQSIKGHYFNATEHVKTKNVVNYIN